MKENLDEFVEQNFRIRCQKKKAIDEGLIVNVLIYKRPGSDVISSQVECKYNNGPHGEYCSLTNKFCAYAVDLK